MWVWKQEAVTVHVIQIIISENMLLSDPQHPPPILFSFSLLSHFDIANWYDACGSVNH